jgi:hypothetical protein
MSAVAAALALSVGVSQCGFAADTATPSQGAAQGVNIEHYTDSYLFELLEPYGTMGNKPNQYDKKYANSFKKLLYPIAVHDKKFMGRITSGPTTKGELLTIDGDQYVMHHICEETICNEVNLVVMYRIKDGRMIGRLWQKCSEILLGDPLSQEVSVLRDKQGITKYNSECK